MAGRRCEGCGKMCSVEVEAQNGAELDVADTGILSVSVDLVLNSACCGYEVATATAEGDEVFEFEHTAPEGAGDDWDCDGELTAEEVSTEATDWYEGKNAKTGKAYPMRYQKHYYGADVNVLVECSGCGASQEVSTTVGEQASGFEDTY